MVETQHFLPLPLTVAVLEDKDLQQDNMPDQVVGLEVEEQI